MARRAKSRRQQRRRPPTLEPRGRMLIVVEGTKTEKFYFEDARKALGLQHSVEIKPGQGSNPKNIVETARKLKITAQHEGNAFSTVYCVFDRDQHSHFQDSINRARHLKMESIKSAPCFEYWVLLHFRDHTAPYARMGNQSACDRCRHDVQAAWPEYRKITSIFTPNFACGLPMPGNGQNSALRQQKRSAAITPAQRFITCWMRCRH